MMVLPDTRLARDAGELLRASAPVFLVHHSVRSYLWSIALAERDAIGFDAELLYVASLLHDIGLMPGFDTGKCFEVDGAAAAERFAIEHGCPAQRAEVVEEAIRLHMVVTLPAHARPETVLLWDATGVDVTGHRYADIEPQFVRRVLVRYPRLDFKSAFGDLFATQAERKPHCRVAEMVSAGYLSRIASAPFSS